METLIDIVESNRNVEVKCYKKVNILKETKEDRGVSVMVVKGVEDGLREYLKGVHLKLGKEG